MFLFVTKFLKIGYWWWSINFLYGYFWSKCLMAEIIRNWFLFFRENKMLFGFDCKLVFVIIWIDLLDCFFFWFCVCFVWIFFYKWFVCFGFFLEVGGYLFVWAELVFKFFLFLLCLFWFLFCDVLMC